jgi:hypothetical protein
MLYFWSSHVSFMCPWRWHVDGGGDDVWNNNLSAPPLARYGLLCWCWGVSNVLLSPILFYRHPNFSFRVVVMELQFHNLHLDGCVHHHGSQSNILTPSVESLVLLFKTFKVGQTCTHMEILYLVDGVTSICDWQSDRWWQHCFGVLIGLINVFYPLLLFQVFQSDVSYSLG